MAVSHLKGNEWCDENASGLEACPALICHFEENLTRIYHGIWNIFWYMGH